MSWYYYPSSYICHSSATSEYIKDMPRTQSCVASRDRSFQTTFALSLSSSALPPIFASLLTTIFFFSAFHLFMLKNKCPMLKCRLFLITIFFFISAFVDLSVLYKISYDSQFAKRQLTLSLLGLSSFFRRFS